MKKLAVIVALLFAVPAHAEEPPPYDVSAPPPANGCAVRLGDAVTINGKHYVPVMITNDYVRNIRNIWGWGSPPDLELTGTVAPTTSNQPEQGHLNGNYWPYTSSAIYSVIGGGWKMQIWGSWDLPLGGDADCTSLPYPDQTSGIAAYLHFTGVGTVRISRLGMYSGNTCFPPGISYTSYQVIDRTVQFPPPSSGEGGGGNHEEAATTAVKTTWGRVKAMFR